jgi:uncharacterized protein
MSNVENSGPRVPASSSPPHTWDFFETILVVLIAIGVFDLTGYYTMAIAFQAYGVACSPAQLQLIWLELQGCWQGVFYIGAALPTIAVLWIAIRMADRDFAEYLALQWPTAREAARAFGIMAIIVLGEGLLRYLVGAESGVHKSDLAVGGPCGLMIMLTGTCMAAPIVEEFVVRGFMFRGWSQSLLGSTGTILLTSALWAIDHTQYDWFGRLNIFAIGLALAHFRWRSGSTWLTVMVHSAINTSIFFTMGPYG